MRIIPKNFFKTLEFILFEILAPYLENIMLITPIDKVADIETYPMKFRYLYVSAISTGLKRYPKKPLNEIITIIPRDVPILFFIGVFKNKVKIGIAIVPPPIPNIRITSYNVCYTKLLRIFRVFNRCFI